MILEMQEGVNMSVLGWPHSPAETLCVDFKLRQAFATPGRFALLSGATTSWLLSLINHD